MAVEDEWRCFTITTAEKLFFYLFTTFGIYLSFMIMTQDAVLALLNITVSLVTFLS